MESPSILTARLPSISRTLIPQPPPQIRQLVVVNALAPSLGTGTQLQFWVQMATSSISFQLMGVRRNPPAAPRENWRKRLRLGFISDP